MADIQGYHLVDDSFNHGSAGDEEYGKGYESRDYSQYPICGLKCAQPFSGARIDPSEYQSRIAEKTAKKTWVRDKCDAVGSKVKNQSRSSYCWIHAPVRAMECNRICQGGSVLTLSAFYAGAAIKNGRNQGGSGITGVQWLAKNGTCLESMWPPMKFTGSVSPDIAANAQLHQILAWEDLDPSDHNAIITNLLCDKPVTVGIPAWTHEVLITFLLWENGEVLFGIDNSWDVTWGTNGRGVLRGRYTRFDEAGAIATAEPSVN